jgi:hypothetical protein
MKLEMCAKKAVFVSKGLVMVTNFPEQNSNCSVVIFCNSRQQSLHIASQLKKKLDMKKLAVDVLNINSSLDKTDKFWQICIFCDNQHSCRGQFHALITTNALNVGIDKHSISLQVHFEWSRDRSQDMRSSCVLFADLVSYIYLMSQLIMTSQVDKDTAVISNDVEEFNPAISLSRHGRPRKQLNEWVTCIRRRSKKKEGYGRPRECPKLIRQSATLAAPALVIVAQSW